MVVFNTSDVCILDTTVNVCKRDRLAGESVGVRWVHAECPEVCHPGGGAEEGSHLRSQAVRRLVFCRPTLQILCPWPCRNDCAPLRSAAVCCRSSYVNGCLLLFSAGFPHPVEQLRIAITTDNTSQTWKMRSKCECQVEGTKKARARECGTGFCGLSPAWPN